MNNRENTFIEAGIPNNATVSGIRQVSIGSIALLQLLNNPFAKVMITGGDLPIDDTFAVLQFVYIHTQDLATVTKQVMQYKVNPDVFDSAVLNYGFTISTDDLVKYISDIMRDKDNIQNAKTETIVEKETETKNAQSQV